LYVLTAIMLGLIAGIIYWQDPFSTFSANERDFAVEDISEIDRIELRTNKRQLELTRDAEVWRVNHTFEVRSRAMLVFLEGLSHLEPEAPVSRKMLPQIQEHLREEGVYVALYKGKRLQKAFYVSRPDFTKQTYMVMDEATLPFAVRIPAFQGQVSALFQVDLNFWRSPMVFDIKPQEMDAVEVTYPKNVNASFRISVDEQGYYQLYDEQGKLEQSVSNERVARYLAFFQAVKYEKILTQPDSVFVDSLETIQPWVKIAVETHGGGELLLEVYRKPGPGREDAFGQQSDWDLNRAYGRLNGAREIIQIQYFVFDPIFKEIDYFRIP